MNHIPLCALFFVGAASFLVLVVIAIHYLVSLRSGDEAPRGPIPPTFRVPQESPMLSAVLGSGRPDEHARANAAKSEMDVRQADFESWYLEAHGVRPNKNGKPYKSQVVNAMWKAWKAAKGIE